MISDQNLLWIQELAECPGTQLESLAQRHARDMLPECKAFASYMRQHIEAHGIKRRDIFLAADIAEGYGYRILEETERTRNREVILRLCLAAGFTLPEVQEALNIYVLPELDPHCSRDNIVICAIQKKIKDWHLVEELWATINAW